MNNKTLHVYPQASSEGLPTEEFEDGPEIARQVPNESISSPSKLKQQTDTFESPRK